MKYTFETTKNGYVEKLELNGKTYKKKHEGTSSNVSTKDADFWEQMEADGIRNEDCLDKIADVLDNNFFAFDLFEIAEQEGE